MSDAAILLQLARTEGIGPVGFVTLLERHGSAAAALAQVRREGGRRVPERSAVEAELAAVADLGATLLLRGRAGYPLLLEAVPDAPPALIVRGDAGLLARPAVGIVGARNASLNGCALARQLARELAAAGLVVVSGLARGIDTAAHEGALAVGGATVAVIATGADLAYPPENAELMERIATQGAVVSERPLGAEARARDFPRRNRVIAGLTLGTLVVEAATGSGSLITARLAADQGREVLAIPGSPLDPRHRGTNQLLRDGAHLVETAADVLEVLGPLMQRAEPPPVRRTRIAPERTGTERAGTATRLPSPAPISPATDLAGRIEQALGPAPLAVDEIIRGCNAPAPDVQAALLDLELAGRIDRHPGNRVSLRAG